MNDLRLDKSGFIPLAKRYLTPLMTPDCPSGGVTKFGLPVLGAAELIVRGYSAARSLFTLMCSGFVIFNGVLIFTLDSRS